MVLIVRQEYAIAKRFSNRLPDREAYLLDVTLAYASGHEDATRLAQDASQRYPDDPVAWYLLGEAYFHLPYQSLASLAKSGGCSRRRSVSIPRICRPRSISSISRSSPRTRRGPIP